MPTIEQNFTIWNEEHDWPLAGGEWSGPWGSERAQWHGCILPRIAPFIPAANILEIGPGHGRWTQFLQAYAKSLTLVDLAPTCIAACRSRFSALPHLRYFVNDGRALDMIDDASLDFVFSFDSLVHADAATMHAYCVEISRKLRVGGTGFIHHSNLGAHRCWLLAKRIVVTACRGNSRLGNLLIHDCMRAPDMTAALMAQFCQDAGLACVAQEIVPWEQSRRSIDCFTVFRKEAVPTTSREPRVLVNHDFLREAENTRRLAELYRLT
jgi:SAM-dependent methyltransferase